MNHSKKILSLLLAVLMLTTTLFTTGCNVNDLVNGILAGITQTTPEEPTPDHKHYYTRTEYRHLT